MSEPDLISIIIPLYNRRNLIEETIQSVVEQTYKNWEVIIVDDGSTDGSYELVESLFQTDTRIKLRKRTRTPKGAPTCRNIGIILAQGELIMFLDSDDILAPYCLNQRITYFRENPNNDFLVFSTLLFQHTPGDSDVLLNVANHEEDLVRFLRFDPVWYILGSIYRRAVFEKIGGFNEDFSCLQDYELHVRALYYGLTYKKLMQLVPDNFYRQHTFESISQKNQTKEITLETYQEVMINIVENLHKHQVGRKEYFDALSSFFFFIAKQWIRHHSRLKKGWQVWRKCYVSDCVSWWRFNIGNLYLLSLATILRPKIQFPYLAYYINKFFKHALPQDYIKLNSRLYKEKYTKSIINNFFNE